MSRYTENGPIAGVMLFLVFVLLLWVAVMLFTGAAFPQDPGPTPNPADYGTVQEELGAWWEWCLVHPNVLMRKSRVAEARGRGVSGREREEKLKVVGALPGRPPFASMIRTVNYEEFIRDGWLVGLWASGWTYETSSSTDIGVGPPAVDVYEEVPE